MNFKNIFIVIFLIWSNILNGQNVEHKWVNEFPEDLDNGLLHCTYFSKIHQTSIGYTIALPKDYNKKENIDKDYPVVYCLHGGNPGNENQILWYKLGVKPIIEDSTAPPIIYVWNNGGKYQSHYDFPQYNSYAETSFIKELIPHIDSNYRTIPNRTARGLLGYSIGGRAACRYIFKYPELFSVSIAIAGGHQREKEISITNGNNGEYQPGDNSWDLARKYSKNPDPPVKLLIIVGTNDKNCEANLVWSSYLKDLGIHHSITLVEGVKHKEVDKILRQLGIKTFHYIFYQSFHEDIPNHK